jgi:hypothetical protein
MNDGDAQIIELLAQHIDSINVLNDKWISDWATLAEKHYKLEEREFVRIVRNKRLQLMLVVDFSECYFIRFLNSFI